MKLYGLPNCNTVKKAREWLDTHGIEYEFHDFKKHGIEAQTLHAWLTVFPWEKLINRSGLTWRGLDASTRARIVDNETAVQLMQEKTSVIKRPILVTDDQRVVLGFRAEDYQQTLNVK